jgi:hypothetical protein
LISTGRFLAVTVFAVVLGACGSGSGSSAPETPTASTTSIPVVAEGAVGAYLEVPTTSVAPGGELTATVVVVNRTAAPITVTSCGPIYGAGLESDTIPNDLAFLACAGPPQYLPVGESRWGVTTRASYSMCGGSGTRESPTCGDGRPPGLPAGEYRLIAGSIDPRAPIPSPLVVTVG